MPFRANVSLPRKGVLEENPPVPALVRLGLESGRNWEEEGGEIPANQKFLMNSNCTRPGNRLIINETNLSVIQGTW